MKMRPICIPLPVFVMLLLSSCGWKIDQTDFRVPHQFTSSNTEATQASNTSQASAGKDLLRDAAAIGETVSYPGCQITVLDVNSEAFIFAGQQLLFSKDDYVFVCVRARISNTGLEEMLPHLILAHLRCADGSETPVHYIGRSLPDNGYYLNKPIRPGESLTGTLVYEIPKSHGDLLLCFPTQEIQDDSGIPFLKFAIPLQQITTRT